jgi:hypothetical protein
MFYAFGPYDHMYSLIFILAVHFSNSVYGCIYRGSPQYSEIYPGLYHEEQTQIAVPFCVQFMSLVQAVHALILKEMLPY